MGNGDVAEDEGIFGSLKLENGVKSLAWFNQGFQLGVVLNGLEEQVVLYDFLKTPVKHHHL